MYSLNRLLNPFYHPMANSFPMTTPRAAYHKTLKTARNTPRLLERRLGRKAEFGATGEAVPAPVTVNGRDIHRYKDAASIKRALANHCNAPRLTMFPRCQATLAAVRCIVEMFLKMNLLAR
jgi:hypothetical protein